MKSCTEKIKDSAYKSKEKIDSLIMEMDQEEPSIPLSNNSIIPIENTQKGLVPDEFYRGKLFPMIENYLPSNVQFTEEEKTQITKGVARKLSGLNCSVPIKCYGDTCPFRSSCPLFSIGKHLVGSECHPPGTLIKTAQHGDIPIELLDPAIHTLVSYEKKRNAIKGGYEGRRQGQKFKCASRFYAGKIVEIITDSNETMLSTLDHISIVRFNEKALNKFCVYLMERNGRFRVGKSQLLKDGYDDKSRMPVRLRLKQENGDNLWILGVYETNSEALFAEEYYSCYLQAPKACFVAPDDRYREKKKYDGLYRWVTQAQLDNHHNNFLRPRCFWSNELFKMGLSIDAPFLTKDDAKKSFDDVKIYARHPMYVRSCNIIPEIMDVPIYSKHNDRKKEDESVRRSANWVPIKRIEKRDYESIVYSLDVERHKTYFANNIASHNCPIEAMTMDLYTKRYLDEFDVDADNFSEVTTMTMLAATHIMEMRAFAALGKDDADGRGGGNGSPDGLIRNVVGFNNDDEPILQIQEHPAYNIIERAWRWRTKLLESLGATRKDKMKNQSDVLSNLNASLSRSSAELKGMIERVAIDIPV